MTITSDDVTQRKFKLGVKWSRFQKPCGRQTPLTYYLHVIQLARQWCIAHLAWYPCM